MKYKILIGCMLCLFSFIPKGAANLVLNPYTSQEISADSIIERVMTFAPSYESIVSDYRANLYIKGKMDIQKKNFILRYVPSMFRLQKGVREYLLETYSDLHYTAPNIYDQKVKASQGTVRGNRGLPGLLEYFNVNIYSSSLLNDERLLSPLAKNGQKYYKYQIDSVMGDPNNLDYRVRFIPRTKSDQLVGGYMVVSSNVWSVREIRFSGRSELITFTCWIQMGDVGKKNEFLPVRYDVEALFKFLGNKVDGNYTASLDYKSIELKEKKVRKKEKRKYNLSESFSLQCDTTDITFINGSAEQYDDKYVDVLNESFNGKVAADIFKAVKKDVEAGVMQEYNLQRMLDGVDKDNSYMYDLMLNFTVPKGNRIGKNWNVYGFTWYEELLDMLGVTKEYSDFGDARSDGIETYSVNISFGENCTNLIAVLKENGLISSKEPLLTYE